MTDKITVLYVKHTQNVLAAVIRVANPEEEITAQALAGPGLLVRGFAGVGPFEVPPEELGVLTVDLEDTLTLLKPRAFQVKADPTDPKKMSLIPITTAGLPQVNGIDLPAIQVTVKFNGQAPSNFPVWVLIDGGSLTAPRPKQGKILANQNNALIEIENLADGEYSILALAPGSPPFSDKTTL